MNDNDTTRLVEGKPHPDWFIEIQNPQGERQWFLRFDVTGVQTRMFGPFDSKENALEYLDYLLDGVLDIFCETTGGDFAGNRYLAGTGIRIPTVAKE